jgi:hypothetical protein
VASGEEKRRTKDPIRISDDLVSNVGLNSGLQIYFMIFF